MWLIVALMGSDDETRKQPHTAELDRQCGQEQSPYCYRRQLPSNGSRLRFGRWEPRHGLPQSYFVTRETAEELVGGQNNPEDDAPSLVQASAA